MQKRIEVARFKPLYVGLFLAAAILVATPLVFAEYCGSLLVIHRVAGCIYSLLIYIGAALLLVVVHEVVHYLAARILRVPGSRLVFNKKLAAVMLDYYYMTPGQYLVVAIAPPLLTPVLLYLGLASYSVLGGIACVMAAANLAGGAPDVVNALYFALVHGDAEKFYLLYRWDGVVEGGVVEYSDRIVVYVM